jgi:hypothetical protein
MPENTPLLKQKPRQPSESKIEITKGEGIMSDVEDEMKNYGASPKITLDSAFAKSLRKKIEDSAENLEYTVFRLTILDWITFGISAICMGIISGGINIHFSPTFDLVQLLALIALGAKSINKGMNFGKEARKKQTQAKELKDLIRQISSIELELYSEQDNLDKASRNKLSEEVKIIWEKFNSIELKGYLPITSPDLSN